MSENKKFRPKKVGNTEQVSEKQHTDTALNISQDNKTSSSSAKRGAKGRRGTKGKSGPANSSQTSNIEGSNALELEFDRDSQLSALQELFPSWTIDDLSFALEEADRDLELTILHITEGHASKWGEVKKKPIPKTKSKPTSHAPVSDNVSSTFRNATRKSKKPSASKDTSRGVRKSKAGAPSDPSSVHAPSSLEKPAGTGDLPSSEISTKAPASTTVSSSVDPGTINEDSSMKDHTTSNEQASVLTSANTAASTNTNGTAGGTSASAKSTSAADQAVASSKPIKKAWASVAKSKKKVTPAPAPESEPPKPSIAPSQPSKTNVSAAYEKPAELSSSSVPFPHKSQDAATPANVETTPSTATSAPKKSTAPFAINAVKPAPGLSNISSASLPKPSFAKQAAAGSQSSTTSMTTARLLSDRFPVVMPVANTAAIPEKVQVRFGSLTLGGEDKKSTKSSSDNTAQSGPRSSYFPKKTVSPKPEAKKEASKVAESTKVPKKQHTSAYESRAPQSKVPENLKESHVNETPYRGLHDVNLPASGNASSVSAIPPQVSAQTTIPAASTSATSGPVVGKQSAGYGGIYSPATHGISPQPYAGASLIPPSTGAAFNNETASSNAGEATALPYSSRFMNPVENRSANSPFDNFQHIDHSTELGYASNTSQQYQQTSHPAYTTMSPIEYGQAAPAAHYYNERNQYSQYDNVAGSASNTPDVHSVMHNKVASSNATSLPTAGTATPSPVVSQQQPQPYAFPPMYPIPYVSYGYGTMPYNNNKFGQPQQGYMSQSGFNDFPPIFGGHSNVYNRQQPGNVSGMSGTQTSNPINNATANTSGMTEKAAGHRDSVIGNGGVTGANSMSSTLGGLSSMSGMGRAAPGMFMGNAGSFENLSANAASPYGLPPQQTPLTNAATQQTTSFQSNANKVSNANSQPAGFPFNSGASTNAGSNGLGGYNAYNQSFINRPGGWYGNA
ncbi:Rnapii degradation factor [Schizosaccharomyces pombe]